MEANIAPPSEHIPQGDTGLCHEVRVLKDYLEDNTLCIALVPDLMLE
jgi:hypothetical protein